MSAASSENNNNSDRNLSNSADSILLTKNSRWEFLDTGIRTSTFNMEFDLKLVEKCRNNDTAFLRFYRWKPYSISLGYNQTKLSKESYIDANKCYSEGMDIVTRPTGGRAVLHSEELTYSVIFKSNKPIQELYKDISIAIMNGLKKLDPKLEELSFISKTPDLLKLIRTGMYNLCFNSSVKNEINYKGKKLVGSAQRKFGDVVLQHGSILIGNHHKNIVNYLNISGEERCKMLKEIDEKTICLNNITQRNIDYIEVSKAVFKGFKETFDISFSKINRVADFIEPRMKTPFIVN